MASDTYVSLEQIMGKGSSPRPFTDRSTFESNFDAIFGKKKHDSQQRTDTRTNEQKESNEPGERVDSNADSLSSSP
jgi:hypothetical protein